LRLVGSSGVGEQYMEGRNGYCGEIGWGARFVGSFRGTGGGGVGRCIQGEGRCKERVAVQRLEVGVVVWCVAGGGRGAKVW
jgi:hypothetical protein